MGDGFQYYWDVNVAVLLSGLLDSGLFLLLLFYAIQEMCISEQ